MRAQVRSARDRACRLRRPVPSDHPRRRAAPKGTYALGRADLEAAALGGCFILWLPGHDVRAEEGGWLAARFSSRLRIGVELLRTGGDAATSHLTRLGQQLGVPLVACGDVQMTCARRQPAAGSRRHSPGRAIEEAGTRLDPNAERYLREPQCLARLYPDALLTAAWRWPRRATSASTSCATSTRGASAPKRHGHLYLREAHRGRKPGDAGPMACPASERRRIEHELDPHRRARRRAVFPHGPGHRRASPARAGSCARDAARRPTRRLLLPRRDRGRPASQIALLFERFITRERNEPPDIDIDFEHERREEVHAVHLRQVRPRARGAHGRGDQLPRASGACATSATPWAFGSDQVDPLAKVMAPVGREAAHG